jgi:hypothetical protein
VELAGIDVLTYLLDQLSHRRVRKQRHLHARQSGCCRQIAHDDGKRMVGSHLVVAERRHIENWNAVESPAEKPQHVESRLVRPVHVFQHEQRRLRGEGHAYRGEQPGALRTIARQMALDHGPQGRRHVQEWSEWSGNARTVACPA